MEGPALYTMKDLYEASQTPSKGALVVILNDEEETSIDRLHEVGYRRETERERYYREVGEIDMR